MVKALEAISAVTLRFMRVYVHASLCAAEDVRVSANQQRNAQAEHLWATVRPHGRRFPAGNRWRFQGQSSGDKGQ
jgi:oligoendopeptidase F